MEKLSPAFLNRFTVINLEDQIENPNDENEVKKAIKYIIESEKNDLDKIDEIIDQIYSLQKTDKFNMSSLARFAKATVRLLKLTGTDNNIEEIVKYMKDLISSKMTDIKIPICIQNMANLLLNNENHLQSEEKFYFKFSPNLRNLMINLYVCSECQIPVCLIGVTGLGKTSMARAFSEIIRKEFATSYSFHMETQLTDLFGVFNFEAGKPVIHDGPLVKAMEEGHVFIADEFNLAEEQILQSFNIALEPADEDYNFLIPDTGKKIKRKNKFFCIVCQNDLSTSGRKKLPELIEKRLRIFEYPSQSVKDLESTF